MRAESWEPKSRHVGRVHALRFSARRANRDFRFLRDDLNGPSVQLNQRDVLQSL
jgi:hypothetical protein